MNHRFPQSTSQRFVIGGIPIHVYGSACNAGAPVVFYTNGRGGHVGHLIEWGNELVQRGFIAIAIDQRNHGERCFDPAAFTQYRDLLLDSLAGLTGLAQDIQLLLDFIPLQLGISCDRTGMIGGSYGGAAVLRTMLADTRIQVGAALITTGDFRSWAELRNAQKEFDDVPFEDFWPAGTDDIVQHYGPLENVDAFVGRPLFMGNGANDPTYPPHALTNTITAMRAAYGDSDMFAHKVYDNIGHECSEQMNNDAFDWLERWLK